MTNLEVHIKSRDLKPTGHFYTAEEGTYGVKTYSRYITHPIAVELYKKGCVQHKFDIYDERGMKVLQDLDVKTEAFRSLSESEKRGMTTRKVNPFDTKDRLDGLRM